MNIRAVLAISIAVAIPALVPGFLSAQGDRQVRITLLESGEVQVSGDFFLEIPSGSAALATRLQGQQVQFNEEQRTIKFSGGLSIHNGVFVVDSNAGTVVVDDGREAPSIRMQDARIRLIRLWLPSSSDGA